MGEGDEGAEEGGEGFEVEECDGVGEGDVLGWCHVEYWVVQMVDGLDV